jgi:hypothetical protein
MREQLGFPLLAAAQASGKKTKAKAKKRAA